MTGLHQALYNFWSGFGVPAYLSGRVPDGSEMPYITFAVASPNTMNTDLLTAFVWVKDQGEGNLERVALLDSIEEAIPAEGTMIDLPTGFARLYRNDVDWMTYYDDPADPDVLGGRVSYQIRVTAK